MQKRIQLTLPIALAMMAGCSDDRAVRLATEAANRQADQNKELVRLNREVAEGTRRLVEADAAARKDALKMQQDLQAQQSLVAQMRDDLEAERRQIASQRLTESMLGPVLEACGTVFLAITAIGFCWYLLYGLRHNSDPDESLAELLVHELVSDQPTLLPLSKPQLAIEDDSNTNKNETLIEET